MHFRLRVGWGKTLGDKFQIRIQPARRGGSRGTPKMKTQTSTQDKDQNGQTRNDELRFCDVFRQGWIDAIERSNTLRGLILVDESVADVFPDRWLWKAIAECPGPFGRTKEHAALLDAFQLWPFARMKDGDTCAMNIDTGCRASDLLDAPRLLAAGIAEVQRVKRPDTPLLLVAKMEHTPALPFIVRLFTHAWILVRNFPDGNLAAPRSVTAVRLLPDVRTGFFWIDTPDEP